MSGSLPTTPAHGSVSLKPCREHVTVRICAGRGRAHRYLIGFYRPNALNPACTPSVVAPKQSDGRLSRAWSRFSPVMARLGPTFSRDEGPVRLISDLFGTLSARSSSLFPFVHDANQPANGIFLTFSFAPVRLPSLRIAHASNVAKGSCHERQSACKG